MQNTHCSVEKVFTIFAEQNGEPKRGISWNIIFLSTYYCHSRLKTHDELPMVLFCSRDVVLSKHWSSMQKQSLQNTKI